MKKSVLVFLLLIVPCHSYAFTVYFNNGSSLAGCDKVDVKVERGIGEVAYITTSDGKSYRFYTEDIAIEKTNQSILDATVKTYEAEQKTREYEKQQRDIEQLRLQVKELQEQRKQDAEISQQQQDEADRKSRSAAAMQKAIDYLDQQNQAGELRQINQRQRALQDELDYQGAQIRFGR